MIMASAKPSKQRKRMFQAPIHKKRRMLAAGLNDELVQKYGARGIPIREGDSVRIIRGDFGGLEGKVERVDYETGRIYVEGMTREKVSFLGTEIRTKTTEKRELPELLADSPQGSNMGPHDEARTPPSSEKHPSECAPTGYDEMGRQWKTSLTNHP